MNLEEAKKILKFNGQALRRNEEMNLSMNLKGLRPTEDKEWGYSLGFLEGYKQCLERVSHVTEWLKFGARRNSEVEQFSIEFLKLLDEIKREVEK